jgi:protein gp37
MGDGTKIEWTDATWNPVTGCTKVSPGCDNCYAKTFAERWRGTPGHHFERGFDLTPRPERLDQPMRWTKPRRIFVNSMSDLFHAGVPDAFIFDVFAHMWWAPQHTFQLLTKRHGRMRSLMPAIEANLRQREADLALVDCPTPLTWPLPNVWLGVSVEDQQRAELRIPALLDTPAAVHWISAEPLLGPVDLGRTDKDALVDGGIDWVVVGGESGKGARPMHPDWARALRDQCVATGVPFLFKQHGAWAPLGPLYEQTDDDPEADEARMEAVGLEVVERREVIQLESSGYIARDHQPGDQRTWLMARLGKKAAGRELDGRTWDEYPAVPP